MSTQQAAAILAEYIKQFPNPCVEEPEAGTEYFHKTILNEFYQVAFRKKVYTDLAELQKDQDA